MTRSPLSPPRRDLLLLALPCVVLGLLGGTPYDHPDFVVKNGLRALEAGGDPGFFRYPALVIYLQGALYGGIYKAMELAGAVDSPEAFVELYRRRVLLEEPVRVPFFLPGHLLTLVFSWLGAVAAYVMAWKLARGSRGAALAAGLLLPASLLWTANAHFLTVDVPVAALAALAGAAALLPGAPGRPEPARRLLGAGALAGLAASAKYPGALVLLAPLTLVVVRHGRRLRLALRGGLLTGGAAAVLFLVTNPFIPLRAGAFLDDLSKEWRHASEGHFGHVTSNAWAHHLGTTLVDGFGPVALGLAAAGLARLLADRGLPPGWRAAATVFPLALFVLLGRSVLSFHRYAVPLLPFLAAWAGLGLVAIDRGLRRLRPMRALPRWAGLALLVAAAAAPGLVSVVRHDLVLLGRDTRRDLVRILEALASEGPVGRVFADDVFTRRFVLRSGLAAPEDTSHRTADGPFDVLVLDGFGHDRYLYQPEGAWQELPLARAGELHVLRVTPFRGPKEEVPFSPESAYSPYPPDLRHRARPGPFVEVYVRDERRARAAFEAVSRAGVACELLPGGRGYYARRTR